MKVVFTIAGLQPEYGGPSRSVPALAAALAQTGTEVALLTCQSTNGQSAPLLPPSDLVRTHLLPPAGRSTGWFPPANPFSVVLREQSQGANHCVLHDHGLWLSNNHAVAAAARVLGLPRIVSPRGMLAGWALSHRGLKKRLAWWIYQQRDLRSAVALHATSPAEAQDFRAAGMVQPIAVIPNGVDIPNSTTARTSLAKGRRTVLFLGRIHPIKGLIDLVRAWAGLRNQKAEGNSPSPGLGSDWRVVIVGGDEGGHLAEVKAETRIQNVENDFEIVGPVEGEAKWEWYRRADLFVLPTKSENFGIVIAEALACGLPVITTQGAPWEDLHTYRCGWWTKIGIEPLAEALRQAIKMTDEERHAMGERGRQMVVCKYTWAAAARQMKSVYAWMLGRGAKPDCVFIS